MSLFRTVGGAARAWDLSRPPRLLVALLLLGVCSCASLRSSLPRLLGYAPQRTEYPDIGERIELMCREWARAQKAPPFVRARIEETLSTLPRDGEDLARDPRCAPEIEFAVEETLKQRPLPFSRLLVARLRSVSDMSLLLDLAELPDDAITPYQLTPEEPGPPPPKRLVRALAVANLPVRRGAAHLDKPRQRAFARLLSSSDDRTLLMRHEASASRLALPWGQEHAPPAEEALQRELLRAWLTDLERRLLGPAERPSFELVLLRLGTLFNHGERLELGPEVRALVERILAAKGEFPLTRGIAHAARDLAELALWMRTGLDVPTGSAYGFADPTSRLERFDPRAELAAEPAGGQATLEQRRSRLHDLEGELTRLRMYEPRCRVLEKMGDWIPAEDALHHFERLTAPLLPPSSPWSTETVCRLRVALALKGVDEASRAGLLVTLLSTPLEGFGPRDLAGEPGGFYIVGNESMRQMSALELAPHLDWIERHAALRAWLDAQSRTPIPLEAEPAATWVALQPAFERLLAFHLSGRPEARPEVAREILRAWMESVRAAEGARVGHVYTGSVMAARLRALGEWAGRAGLTAEVAAFLQDRQYWRVSAVATYLLTLPPPGGEP